MSINRRNLIKMLPAAAAITAAKPSFGSPASSPQHVVVVGGGFAGCTVAKYLRMWSNGTIKVTLVEPKKKHVSCIMSNLVLNEQLKLNNLVFDYTALQHKYGVNILRAKALDIDGAQKQLKLKGLEPIGYDSLVVATGIKFDKIPGLNSGLTPHAWIAGRQTNVLRDQIRAMPRDGAFVMTIPQAPYRCPPGPYERACLVADILKRRGGNGRVVVLDENNEIQAEKETFSRAFNELYGEIIEYINGAEVLSVDSVNRSVTTSKGTYGGFQGDVLNVIPRHRAQQLLVRSGLTGGSRFAPVDPVTYGSSLADFPDVYVIGDAQDTRQPKSGHMANSQAKVCADAIVRCSLGWSAHTQERLENITTNSACFSPINLTEASWLTAVFKYNQEAGAMALVPGALGEAHSWNSENYRDMFAWSENLFADTFG